ncbi:helix-turn-helix domain-containing protein [Microbacterium sp. ZW T5_45]|uniref:helix-turn-helix domain-containing protein n=1 Tax=Microbacterium sp. ZW T5_45 TaxID=3378080 RepID=UPI0038545102
MTQERTAFGDLMTVEEVADALRRTVSSVRWLIHDKQIKSGKISGRRMIRRSDLEAYIAAAFEEQV